MARVHLGVFCSEAACNCSLVGMARWSFGGRHDIDREGSPRVVPPRGSPRVVPPRVIQLHQGCTTGRCVNNDWILALARHFPLPFRSADFFDLWSLTFLRPSLRSAL